MIPIESLLSEARLRIETLQAEVARLNQVNQLMNEQVRLLNLRFFGPKADKLSPNQMQLLLQEVSLTQPEVDREADRPEVEKRLVAKSKKPRAEHPGRERLPEHLERREEVIACPPQECKCAHCGAERPVIGYAVKETLMCKPAEFWVKVVKREKRGSHCLEEHGVVTAAAPAQIVPKGKLSNEFIIEVLASKYQQHLPIYRQCAWMEENHQIELSRKTLTHAVLAAGALLRPVVQEQARELLAGTYLQADETTLPCQTGERTGKNHKAYLWQYSRPKGPVVFDFRMGRGRAGPKEFLRTFKGILQCDGYGAYADLGAGIVYAGCMAHARRGFVEAARLAPQDPLPQEVLDRIGEIYAVEAAARAGKLSHQARQDLRQQKTVPLMGELKKRITGIRQESMPGTKLADACDYALGQWPRLEVFLHHGIAEVDNNWCEGAMRPLALGRKNWLHVGSAEAGPKVAAIASIVETCRRLEINLRDYLNDVLSKLASWSTTTSQVSALTPAAWKAARSA